MRPADKIEQSIKQLQDHAGGALDDRTLADACTALEQSLKTSSAPMESSLWRTTMKNKYARLAAAAVFVAAILLGAYLITGSLDGSSITLAEVKAAMDQVDWMKIVNVNAQGNVQQTDWFSFASKVHVTVVGNIGISYADYNARHGFFWPERADYIVESPMASKQFAHGAAGPFEMIQASLHLAAERAAAEIVKERSMRDGRPVEIWTLSGADQTITVTVDRAAKRPVAATFQRKGPVGIAEDNTIRFEYPQTGPADIFEAGAPKSARIVQTPDAGDPAPAGPPKAKAAGAATNQ